MEFLPYPHLIATLFNGCAFGPPLPLTAASSWTWVDHPVSGLPILTSRPVKTRFPFGSVALPLNLASTGNSPDRSTKSTPSTSIYHRCPTACKHRVSGSLSLPSRGPFHLSFTVLCTIGHRVVFSLGGWSPLLPAGFLVSRGTPDPAMLRDCFAYGALTPSGRLSQNLSATSALAISQSSTPVRTRTGLGSSYFARRYFRNRCFFLFLALLRCFSSGGSPIQLFYSLYSA